MIAKERQRARPLVRNCTEKMEQQAGSVLTCVAMKLVLFADTNLRERIRTGRTLTEIRKTMRKERAAQQPLVDFSFQNGRARPRHSVYTTDTARFLLVRNDERNLAKCGTDKAASRFMALPSGS